MLEGQLGRPDLANSHRNPPQAVAELPPGFLGQFEGGEEGLDYFLAKQVRLLSGCVTGVPRIRLWNCGR